MTTSDRRSSVSTASSLSQAQKREEENVQTKPRDPLNPHNLTEDEKLEVESTALHEEGGGIYLSLVAKELFGTKISPLAFKKYMAKLHAECGNSTDPVERMMLEQLTIAHHSLARLMVKAASADNFELAAMYQSASTKLLAEFRRLALSIKKYREPSSTSQFVVIKQQNNAGAQQIAFVEAEQNLGMLDGKPEKSFSGNELGSKEVPQPVSLTIAGQESTPSPGWPKEPKKAKRTERKGSKGSPRGRIEE